MCLMPKMPEMPEPEDPLPPPPAPPAPPAQVQPLPPPESVSGKDRAKLKQKTKRGTQRQIGRGAEQLRIERSSSSAIGTGTTATKKSSLNIPGKTKATK